MRYNIWWFNLFCIQRLTSQCMARREKKGKHCWLIIATRRFTCNFPSQRVCSRATCPNLSKINQRYYHHTNIALQKQRDGMLKHWLLQKHCGEGNSRVLIPNAFLRRWWISTSHPVWRMENKFMSNLVRCFYKLRQESSCAIYFLICVTTRCFTVVVLVSFVPKY